MGRPTDWAPLASADPVPGDPGAVSREAAHLSAVAEEIQGQVARLRAIAAGGSVERGLHVEKLKSAASDVAGQLDKVVGRYQKTSAALTKWVPDLEYAQSQSLKALAQAQAAAAQQARYGQPVMRPAGQQETAAQKQADQARQRALDQANADLAAAHTMLGDATSHRDQKARAAAAAINNAINDGVTDSWWDQFKSFIGKYAWLIKDICTGLEILATALAVICLFIPGLNIVDALLLIAFGATLLATIGRGVLATTGNGSWLDFGLDVLALATFGASRLLSGGMGGAAEGAAKLGQGLVQQERATTAAEYVTKYFGNTAGRLIGQGKALEVASQWAAKDIPDLALEGGKAGYLTRFVNAVKAGGSLDDWAHFSKIAAVFGRYGDNPEVANAMRQGTSALNALRFASGFSFGGAFAGLVGGGGEMDNAGGPVFRVTLPGISGTWDKLENLTTTSGGLTTGQANDIVNGLQFTPLGPGALTFRGVLGGGW
jgi:hypothetical protein